MPDIEKLQEFGADTNAGLKRCLDNEVFYLRLVKKFADDDKWKNLSAALDAGDLEGAFALAHNLKGSSGNLGLIPVYEPILELSDLLKTGTQADYKNLLTVFTQKMCELQTLCSD